MKKKIEKENKINKLLITSPFETLTAKLTGKGYLALLPVPAAGT